MISENFEENTCKDSLAFNPLALVLNTTDSRLSSEKFYFEGTQETSDKSAWFLRTMRVKLLVKNIVQLNRGRYSSR